MDSIFDPYREYIDGQARSFKAFIRSFLLNDNTELLDEIARQTKVYIFSGVIRNFFCGIPQQRDLDIVIKNINQLKISTDINSFRLTQNSFGGWKVQLNNLIIDTWGLENTWGIKKDKLEPTPESLIKTSFFNFSSIAYDYNEERFIYDTDFLLFLITEMMDVVYTKNPNIPLCVINSLHYRMKFGYGLSANLCQWLVRNSTYVSDSDYRRVQLKHFSSVIYNISEIEKFIQECSKYQKKGILPIRYL